MVAISRTTFSNARPSIETVTFDKSSLQYVRKGPIDNNPALVQIMAWRLTGAKPLHEP